MTNTASPLTSHALFEFLDVARIQGFTVGTDQVLAAADIVAATPLRYGRSIELGEFRTLLAPIIASSEDDQRAFYELFDSWIAGRSRLRPSAQPASHPKPVLPTTRIERLIRSAPPWPHIVALVIMTTLLGTAIFFRDFFQAIDLEQPPQQTLDEAGGQSPPPPADVVPETVQRPLGEEPEIILQSERRVAISAQAADSLIHAFRISLACLPLFLAIAWWGWRQRRLQVWLRRRASAGTPDIRALGLRQAGYPLFLTKKYRLAFQKLRRHHLRSTTTANVNKTVERSLLRGGDFAPVYKSRRLVPEYLVLIDQVDYRDQQAALLTDFVQRLRQEGVLAHLGYFFGDPRFVFLDSRGRQRVDLGTLRKSYHDHCLLIISDASGLFQPASGLPTAWVDALAGWETRVILSPSPPEEWGYRERQLHELGFWVLPMDEAGISTLAESLARRTEQDGENGGETPILRPLPQGAPFPPVLAPDPEAWLEPIPPREGSLDALIRETRTYLGENGFRLLAASAIYPQLDWNLTRFLDRILSKLSTAAEVTEERLLSLAKLPWFRFGRMPDFLRLRLVGQMSEAEQRTVREGLRRLIADAVEGRVPGRFDLSVAMPARKSARRWLHDLIRAEPQPSPYRDYIFARFIVGGKPSPLDFRLPRSVRQVLSPSGNLHESLPWLLGLPTAAILSAGLWLGFPTVETQFRNLIQPATDLIAEVTAPHISPRIVLRGHEDELQAASFSPEGRRVVTASSDGTSRLWDADSGSEIGVLRGHEDKVRAAAFSSDGRRVVTASWDKTARLWDADSGTEIAVLRGHKGRVGGAVFGPEGRRVVTASADATARLWDANSGSEIAVLRGHEGAIYAAAFSPDGRQVVTASADATARLWDADSGTEIAVLRGHEGSVYAVAFTPDGRRVVTASADATARLWDANSGAEITVLRGHEDLLFAASFSPDGRQVVTASRDGTARLWDADSGRLLGKFVGHTSSVHGVTFSTVGRRVATASQDGTAMVWNAETFRPLLVLKEHEGQVFTAHFSPDGRRIVTASGDQTAMIWELQPIWAVPLKTFTAEVFRLRLAEEIENGLIDVIESGEATRLRLRSDALFASGSDTFDEKSRLLVRKIAHAINDHPGPITVVGHTDNVPIRTVRFPSNFELSKARADTVREIIASIVREELVLISEGRSDVEPIAPNDTSANRSQNRRVEIVIPQIGARQKEAEAQRQAEREAEAQRQSELDAEAEAQRRAEAQRKQALVSEAQRQLVRLGYDPGPVDGREGRSTTRAVRSFQTRIGMRDDGVINEMLVAVLKNARPLTERVPELEPVVEHFDPRKCPPNNRSTLEDINFYAGILNSAERLCEVYEYCRNRPDSIFRDVGAGNAAVPCSRYPWPETVGQPAPDDIPSEEVDARIQEEAKLRDEKYVGQGAQQDAETEAQGQQALVRDAQRQLTRLGYAPGPVDGVQGTKTTVAVREFQNSEGMPSTGIIDEALVATLKRARPLSEKISEPEPVAEQFDPSKCPPSDRSELENVQFFSGILNSAERPCEVYEYCKNRPDSIFQDVGKGSVAVPCARYIDGGGGGL